MKTKVVSSTEIGTNCWLPCRFIKGERCERVNRCNYPEKKDCKAVQAEIDYLSQRLVRVQEETAQQIKKLREREE